MSQISTYPMQDDFETTLSQARDWTTGTIYVQSTPSFTFPANTTTYVIVDPWTSKMQLAEISAYNSTLKTITVSNVTLNKWPSYAYTQQSHNIWAVVRISDNYEFRADIVTAVNTKVNTNSTDIEVGKFANEAARDAYFTSPQLWNSAYLIAEWYWTDYTAWWRDERASWAVANASTTTAGKVEIATDAEITAWTRTGATGAILSVAPDDLAQVIQSQSYLYFGTATDSGTDAYIATIIPSLTAYTTGNIFIGGFAETNTTTTPTLNINWLWAMTIVWNDSNPLTAWDIVANRLYMFMKSTSNLKFVTPIQARTDKLWIIEVATDAEVVTGTDTERAVTPYQIYTYAKPTMMKATRVLSVASWTVTYNHSLWKIPTHIEVKYICDTATLASEYNWFWYYSLWTARCMSMTTITGNISFPTTRPIDCNYTVNSVWQKGVIQNLTSTTFDVVWTKAWSPTYTAYLNFILR